MSIFCVIDDKHIPLYRVLWVSDIPHFCGSEDCLYEGKYEVRLEGDESVFGGRDERDRLIRQIEQWQHGSFDEDTDTDSDWTQ